MLRKLVPQIHPNSQQSSDHQELNQRQKKIKLRLHHKSLQMKIIKIVHRQSKGKVPQRLEDKKVLAPNLDLFHLMMPSKSLFPIRQRVQCLFRKP